MSSKKVFIKSIPRDTATGVNKFSNPDSGKSFEKTKVGEARTKIRAMPSAKIGGLKNGLSYKPWIDPETGKVMVDSEGKELTLQDKMERKWGLEPGYLTNKTGLNPTKYDPTVHDTYYHVQSWTLNDGTTMLDLSKMNDELGYHVILDHILVANSYNEWRQHKWPYAEFYIAIENESDELKYQRKEKKGKLLGYLHNEVMTGEMKRNFCYLLELANSLTGITDVQAYNLLYDFIDNSTFTAGSNIDRFEELVQLISTATGREELSARLLLRNAMDTRVIYNKAETYVWVRPKGTIELGSTYMDAIMFLLDPKKEALTEELKETIKSKMI